MPSLAEVDRIAITTVVDNYIDTLRPHEKVARRFDAFAARQVPDLRAEHGLAHFVEVTRGRETTCIAFDFGPSDTALTHNFRVLGLDPGRIDLLALSHGHYDHWGGLGGLLRTYRRSMKKVMTFYGGEDHFLPRWTQRGNDRVSLGRLHRDEIDSLYGKVREKGLTLVPTRMYFKDGRVKVELALARGRERADKRRVIAERDAQRQIERALKRRR